MTDDLGDREELERLRDGIDALDRELVDLVARRRDLVDRVADWKRRCGASVYAPERERRLLRERREEAAARGVPPGLVEDLLRRIMRESYVSEGRRGYRRTRAEPCPVTLVGGGGGMGRLFHGLFEASGYEVRVLERDDWDRADALLEGAGLVLVGVPIAETTAVIDALRGRVPRNAVLADITSVKSAPLARMLAVHDGPVVGLHPMFGPSVASPAKQVIARCPGRDDPACAWVLEQLSVWGAVLVTVSPEDHDRRMAVIQAQRHFATFVYGVHLMEEGTDLAAVLDLSSPIYRLELGMVGRLFAQDPGLYADIIFGSQEGLASARRYHERFATALAMYAERDLDAFREAFVAVRNWFGPLAEKFLAESTALLAQAGDRAAPGIRPDEGDRDP